MGVAVGVPVGARVAVSVGSLKRPRGGNPTPRAYNCYLRPRVMIWGHSSTLLKGGLSKTEVMSSAPCEGQIRTPHRCP